MNDVNIHNICKMYSDPKFYCEFKQYLPHIFYDILNKDRITYKEIATSFYIEQNRENLMEYIQQEKVDRDVLLITFNKKFILKRIRNRQHRAFMKHMVQKYHAKITDDSYLQHIYGIFKLTILGKQYRFLLLENPFKNLSAPVVTKLKWSEVQKDGEQDDLSLILQQFERVLGSSITLYPRDITKLHETLIDDLNFLKHSYMDDFAVTLGFAENEVDRNIRNRFYGSLNGEARVFVISISEFLNMKPEKRRRCCQRRAEVMEDNQEMK